jgi:broad specificity polyphosphatase/5'/3'-nucleotidase SurE
VLLNVNFPNYRRKTSKEYSMPSSKAIWVENLTNENASGRDYYWLGGEFVNQTWRHTDEWAQMDTYQ